MDKSVTPPNKWKIVKLRLDGKIEIKVSQELVAEMVEDLRSASLGYAVYMSHDDGSSWDPFLAELHPHFDLSKVSVLLNEDERSITITKKWARR